VNDTLYRQAIIDPTIPDHAVPVDVVDHKYTLSVRRGYQQTLAIVAEQNEPVEEIIDLLSTMDHLESLLLFDVEMIQDEKAVWEALATRTCYIATDGSAPEGKG
jgi:hypothetical protein